MVVPLLVINVQKMPFSKIQCCRIVYVVLVLLEVTENGQHTGKEVNFKLKKMFGIDFALKSLKTKT